MTIALILSGVVAADAVIVIDPYVRAMPPGQKVTGAFLSLKNDSGSDRSLVRAESDVAKNVEMHEHVHKDGMMQMREVEKIDIAKGSTTALKPGGLHIMLIGLTRELNVGDIVDIKLIFDDGSELIAKAPVKKILAGMGMMKKEMGKKGPMGDMKQMKHASPMPNLMGVVKKNAQQLALNDDQMKALKQWSDVHQPRVWEWVGVITSTEKQLHDAVLKGASRDELDKMTLTILDTRQKIIRTKIMCVENLRAILSADQWNKLMEIYAGPAK
jgi:copper(I)-binding protein